MPTANELIWTVLTNGLSPLIAGGVGYCLAKLQEKIKIQALLTQGADVEFIETIGCAGLKVTIVNKSKRQIKIRSAFLIAGGIDFMPVLQATFNTDFGHSPVAGKPPPSLVVELQTISNPNSEHGFVLERDDICEFALPIQVPALPLFLKAHAKDVEIGVRFFDESEKTLIRGESIQNNIRTLIATWGDKRQILRNPVKFQVRAWSNRLPDASVVGTVNKTSVTFNDETHPMPVVTSSARGEQREEGPFGIPLAFQPNDIQIGRGADGALIARLSASILKELASRIREKGAPVVVTLAPNHVGGQNLYITISLDQADMGKDGQSLVVPILTNPPKAA